MELPEDSRGVRVEKEEMIADMVETGVEEEEKVETEADPTLDSTEMEDKGPNPETDSIAPEVKEGKIREIPLVKEDLRPSLPTNAAGSTLRKREMCLKMKLSTKALWIADPLRWWLESDG